MSNRLAELDALMADPDYQPTLASPVVVAGLFGVTRSAISKMSERSERTGVKRYPGGKVDAVAVARWLLRRDQAKVTRARS